MQLALTIVASLRIDFGQKNQLIPLSKDLLPHSPFIPDKWSSKLGNENVLVLDNVCKFLLFLFLS